MRRALAKLFRWISRLCCIAVVILLFDCAVLPLFSIPAEDTAKDIQAGVFYFVLAVVTEMLSARLGESRRKPAGTALNNYRRVSHDLNGRVAYYDDSE